MSNNNIQATKVKIVKTALSLFQEKGYNNVSVKDIASACNLTRGAFYYYYKTKDAILDDIYIAPNQLTMSDLNQILKSDKYIEQFYQLHALFLQQSFEAGPKVVGEVYKQYIDKGSQVMFEPKNFPAHEMYVHLIQKAKDTGQIKTTVRASTLADAASHIANSLGIIWCSKDGEYDYQKEFVRIMDELFMNE